MRSLPITPMMVLFLIGLGGYLGCDPNTMQVPSDVAEQGAEQGDPPSGFTTAASVHANSALGATSMPERQASTVLIGSFNMQRLGPSKLGNPWVMDKFAEHDVASLCLLDPASPDKPLALITRSNVIKRYHAALGES